MDQEIDGDHHIMSVQLVMYRFLVICLIGSRLSDGVKTHIEYKTQEYENSEHNREMTLQIIKRCIPNVTVQ